MKPETFEKKLKKALEIPGDWHITGNGVAVFLTHKKTGIGIPTNSIIDSPHCVVFAPDGTRLLTAARCFIKPCYDEVIANTRKNKERVEKRKRDKFVGDFKGFERC